MQSIKTRQKIDSMQLRMFNALQLPIVTIDESSKKIKFASKRFDTIMHEAANCDEVMARNPLIIKQYN